MSATDLLARLQKAGCCMRADGDVIRVQDAKKALTDELRQEIREHKGELLQLLKAGAETEPSLGKVGCHGDPMVISNLSDSVSAADFVREHCILAPHAEVIVMDLLRAYASWRQAAGDNLPVNFADLDSYLLGKGCVLDVPDVSRKPMIMRGIALLKGVYRNREHSHEASSSDRPQ